MPRSTDYDVWMLASSIEKVEHEAAKLGIQVSHEQATSVTKNFLVSEYVERWHLTPEERDIAVQLRCRLLKEASGGTISDANALADAKTNGCLWGIRRDGTSEDRQGLGML